MKSRNNYIIERLRKGVLYFYLINSFFTLLSLIFIYLKYSTSCAFKTGYLLKMSMNKDEWFNIFHFTYSIILQLLKKPFLIREFPCIYSRYANYKQILLFTVNILVVLKTWIYSKIKSNIKGMIMHVIKIWISICKIVSLCNLENFKDFFEIVNISLYLSVYIALTF